MEAVSTSIPGVLVLRSDVFCDRRGHFLESYNRRELARAGIHSRFVQDNVSHSRRNVVRGLHYQTRQHAQGKLVRALHGSIYDVAVDIRIDSPAFGCHFGIELNAEEGHALWIPAGLAHGFSVLSEEAVVHYKVTNYYFPQHERCLRWNDPELGIEWPLNGPALLSPKDAIGASLSSLGLAPESRLPGGKASEYSSFVMM
jgi:dTDP-4-dehydrorhamnose 3,5-epimerase